MLGFALLYRMGITPFRIKGLFDCTSFPWKMLKLSYFVSLVVFYCIISMEPISKAQHGFSLFMYCKNYLPLELLLSVENFSMQNNSEELNYFSCKPIKYILSNKYFPFHSYDTSLCSTTRKRKHTCLNKEK